MLKAQSGDFSRLARRFVNLDDDRANPDIAFRVVGAAGGDFSKAFNDLIFLHPDHARVTPRHSDIGDVSRAAFQNSLVRRWNVRVRTVNGGNFSC